MTVGIACQLGVPSGELRSLRRAALLHDLGKLGVSSLILDKPGKLTDEEFAVIRRHPEHTHRILSRVGGFSHLVYGAELSIPLSERSTVTGSANLITPAATGTVDAFLGVSFFPKRSALRQAPDTFAPVHTVANNPTMAIDLRR